MDLTHLIEPAASGRSRCRGCGRAIAKGELPFGESLPSSYREGAMALWFHLVCSAYKRPISFAPVLAGASVAKARDEDR